VDSEGRRLPAIENDPLAVQAIQGILQVAASFSKYSDSAPWDRIPEYCREFVAVDQALSDIQFPRHLISAAANVITQVFDRFDLSDIEPRHGPGAVASGERDEQKWVFKRIIQTAQPLYPFNKYFVGGTRWMDEFSIMDTFGRITEVPSGVAKLIFVEKTSSSLRTISMEPLELQYLQQGIMSKMVAHLQKHPLTRGHVNFDDQTINGNLALVNSFTQVMGTMDLSAASDRLSLDLVKALFANVDDNVLRYLVGTRSTHTKLPDGTLVELRKFAPMGSAVCFPTQSIVFFALCVAAISMARNISVYDAAQVVYVYGDDIIVNSSDMHSVAVALESVGLKVNYTKSFHRGFFRESCGMFAFAGKDITPIRFRKSFPRTRGDGRTIASWLSYSHDCDRRGYRLTAEYIYTCIEDLIGKLPYGLDGCGYFCRRAADEYELAVGLSTWPHYRYNTSLWRFEIKVLVLHTPFRDADFKTPFQRLTRDLLTDFSESDPSKVPVGRSGKPKSAWRPII
jgi:hypothetical protein